MNGIANSTLPKQFEKSSKELDVRYFFLEKYFSALLIRMKVFVLEVWMIDTDLSESNLTQT